MCCRPNPAHTRRLRIFTPGAEMPFAGHPTVGTAFILASIGEIPVQGERTSIVFEEGVGPVPVAIRAENGVPVFSQLSAALMPEFGPPSPPPADLAAVLGLCLGQLQKPRAVCKAPRQPVQATHRGLEPGTFPSQVLRARGILPDIGLLQLALDLLQSLALSIVFKETSEVPGCDPRGP
mgnify:CR=1 FL=1